MSRRRFPHDKSPFSGHQTGTTAWSADREDVIMLLEEAAIDSCSLIPWGSNYTFLITLQHPREGCSYAIYKPQRGEAPLYDFPDGTLFQRERAAYLLSCALGWNLVPPTIIRDGPYGIGMVQLFIEADSTAHYFTFGAAIPEVARRIALFDCVINNTDRKAGHLLRALDGRIWAIDHGLTFHAAPKLRTVIWEFAGEALPQPLMRDLSAWLSVYDGARGPLAELRTLLNPREREALRRRVEYLLKTGSYPQPASYRAMPWPAI